MSPGERVRQGAIFVAQHAFSSFSLLRAQKARLGDGYLLLLSWGFCILNIKPCAALRGVSGFSKCCFGALSLWMAACQESQPG
jgi:hypothetical protein